MYAESVDETAIPARMHITGASTNISRTITPFNNIHVTFLDDQVMVGARLNRGTYTLLTLFLKTWHMLT